MERKFVTIANRLRAGVKSGEFKEKLPSEVDLAKRHGVAPLTVRQALRSLVDEGLIEKVPGVGTFVKVRSRDRVAICLPPGNPLTPWIDSLTELIELDVPNCRVEFIESAPGNGESSGGGEGDLIMSPATSRIPYGNRSLPISGEVTGCYDGDRYSMEPFSVHAIGKTVYGLPILFSPALLLLNTSILPEMKGTTPAEFTLERLIDMARILEEDDSRLFSAATAEMVFRYLVFSVSDGQGRAASINVQELTRLLKRCEPIFRSEAIDLNPKAFAEGNVALTDVFRQSRQYDFSRSDYALLPFPKAPGGKAIVGGEFLLLSSESKNTRAALDVARAFLSERVQGLIAENRVGLPVMKHLGMSSLNSFSYRDDLFFLESRNMLLNNASEQEFNLRLSLFFRDLMEKKISFRGMLELIKYEIETVKTTVSEKNRIEWREES